MDEAYQAPKGLKVCILVPAYNERRNVGNVVKGCLKYAPDVVVVDDGSSDETSEIARQAGATVIAHDVNRGKGAALKTGFDYVLKGDWEAVIVVDGDGQHDRDEIPKIIDTTIRENAAITIGNRMSDLKDMPLPRRASNWITSWIISKLAGQYVPDSQCGFRLIRTNLLREIELATDNFEMESEMIIIAGRKGYKVSSVAIRTIYLDGRQRLGPGQDALKFIRLFAAHIFGFR